VNRDELVKRVRTHLNDSTANPGVGFFAPDAYISAIDEANQVVNSVLSSIDSEYFRRPSSFSLEVGKQSYKLPPDAARVHEVYWVDTGGQALRLESMRVPMLLSATDPGPPCSYFVRRNQIDIYPSPDAVHTISFYFDQVMTNLTLGTEVPSSPVEFHDMIAIYAAIIMSASDDRPTAKLEKLYAVRQDDLILTYGYRSTSRTPSRGIFGD
jgi:hypothetical protein